MFRRSSITSRLAPAVALLALLSFGLAACSSAAPAVSDPKEILTKGVANLEGTKSFHMDLGLAGSIKLNLGGSASAGSGTPFPLDGTSVVGDVDVAGKKIALTASVPALMGFKADVIVADNAAYVRAPLLTQSNLWVKTPITGSAASTVTDPQKTIDEMKKFLDQPGVNPTKQADEKVGDQDCYKVTFTIPASSINSAAGAAASQLPGGVKVGDLSATAWVRKSDMKLTKLAADVPLGDMGTPSLTLTLSKFDEPVTITAPPADQVKPA
jgi:hypothetical protein